MHAGFVDFLEEKKKLQEDGTQIYLDAMKLMQRCVQIERVEQIHLFVLQIVLIALLCFGV